MSLTVPTKRHNFAGAPALCCRGLDGRTGRACPLWVKSRHRSVSSQCLLYPQKRALKVGREMSALCQKQTFRSGAIDGFWSINARGREADDWNVQNSCSLS